MLRNTRKGIIRPERRPTRSMQQWAQGRALRDLSLFRTACRAGAVIPQSVQALPRHPDLLDVQITVQHDKIGPPPDGKLPPV